MSSEQERHSRAEANVQFLIKYYDGRIFFFPGVLHGLIIHHKTSNVYLGSTYKVSRVIFDFMMASTIFNTIGKTMQSGGALWPPDK